MQNLVGKTFTHNGIELVVKEIFGSGAILWSTNGPGVWFATEAQMRAALRGDELRYRIVT